MGLLRETIEKLIHDSSASVAKLARSLKIPRWQSRGQTPARWQRAGAQTRQIGALPLHHFLARQLLIELAA